MKAIPIFGFLFIAGLLSGCVSSTDQIRASHAAALQTTTPPTKIAIMLPFSGELSNSSAAIRSGILAAYYQAPASQLTLQIIDTHGKNLNELYDQAVQDDVQMIIGPLTKAEVNVLAKRSSLPIPVIALNSLDNYQNKATVNLYQFGFLPQDEAAQAAERMFRQGITQVAVITPNNSWGDKIAAAFKNSYQGEITAVLRYTAKSNLSPQLCKFLSKDGEELCNLNRKPKNLQPPADNLEIEPAPAEPTCRQDIAGIFLVATPEQARQIIPLLKFYFAGHLPIYTISAAHGGNETSLANRDLEGVIFCDAPLLIAPHLFAKHADLTALYQQLMAPENRITPPLRQLFILGCDAYLIATNFMSFLQKADQGFIGASGRLYLDQYNHIYRQLPWNKIINGRRHLLPI